MERRASDNASEEVSRAGGVDTGGTTVAVAAGAEGVVLEFLRTSATDDLCALALSGMCLSCVYHYCPQHPLEASP